jgi:hypothetical protein
MARMGLAVPRYCCMVVRAITESPSCASSEMRASWTPSRRYSCSGSAVRLVRGSTARRSMRGDPMPATSPQPATARASPVTAAAAHRHRCRRRGRGTTTPPVSASANARAVGNRSVGSFARARSTARSTNGGTSGAWVRSRGTVRAACLTRSAREVGPSNGARPDTISKRTQPRAYTSVRASTSPVPNACSGLMYAGVPIARPVPVSRSAPAASTARAMPKSATMAWSPARRMFSGLISLWTTPRSWA